MTKYTLKKLLVIEDDSGLQSQLRWCFGNYKVLIAANRKIALELLRQHSPAVVTLDLGLPPDPTNTREGFKALNDILDIAPYTKVIVVTGNDDRVNAMRAIELGAYDFYEKPIDPDILGLIIDRAYHVYALEADNRTLDKKDVHSPLKGLIAASPQMLKICHDVKKVAPTNTSTLILGESGTGKELIARALHDLSERAQGPFIAINCAAIPETLLESELFGYEKGAFTGANKTMPGKIEFASGGTFFLDEIGDLPMTLQAKMLRFIQERVIERVGGRTEIPVDIRIISASHQNLRELIQKKLFREDLYYRISEVTIELPPLREREGDILLLAKVFLNRFKQSNSKSARHFAQDALTAMALYSWPGNVRELENKVKRAAIMAVGQSIQAKDLELKLNAARNKDSVVLNLREIKLNTERKALTEALVLANDNVAKAADLLGVSRPTLYDLMSKYGYK